MEEQAEDLEDMYTKRMELYRKSVKKDNRKKRRRVDGMCMYVHVALLRVSFEHQMMRMWMRAI